MIAIGFTLMATVLVVFEIAVFRSQWLSLLLTFGLVGAAFLIEVVLARPVRLKRAA